MIKLLTSLIEAVIDAATIAVFCGAAFIVFGLLAGKI
jgi:hypothetical protein